MDHPRWKIWLSYLTDLPLRRVESSVNKGMQLWLSKGQLKLTTPRAIYSYGSYYRSYANAFERLQLHEHPEVRRVLVLGWGIGSIGKLLADHPGINHIIGVEHDQALVELYQNELAADNRFRIEIRVADAIDFVHECSERFDLICSDVFVDNVTPSGILQEDYLRKLEALRSDTGTVLVSKLHMSVHDRQENEALEHTLSQIVPSFSKLDTIGNRVFAWGTLKPSL